MEIITQSAKATKEFGEKTATYLTSNQFVKERSKDQAVILGLSGELGSGKTTFVQGLAQRLGIPYRVLSPTFLVVREYELTKIYDQLVHIDLYNLQKLAEVKDLGLDQILTTPTNIVVIEWIEKIIPHIRVPVISFQFEFLDITTRKISYSGINL